MAITVGTPAFIAHTAPQSYVDPVFRTALPVTIAAGETVLSVLIGAGPFGPPTSVSFNGVPLTRRDSNIEGYVFVYDLLNPTVGTYDVHVDHTSGGYWGVAAIPLAGVDLTTPRRSVVYEYTYGVAQGYDFTTVAGDLLLDVMSVGGPGGGAVLPVTDGTELFSSLGNNGVRTTAVAFSQRFAAGTTTPSNWTTSGSYDLQQLGVVYIPAASGPAASSVGGINFGLIS